MFIYFHGNSAFSLPNFMTYRASLWDTIRLLRLPRLLSKKFTMCNMITILRAIGTILLGTPGLYLLAMGNAQAEDIRACLITKTDINPFFVEMKRGAAARADALGIELSTFAGKVDGDHETQVQSIETCIASGAKGILLAASDPKAIVPVVKQARGAGLLVIALDTPLEPMDAADATFATDNFKAGRLIGKWARASLGKKADSARIAMLDLALDQPSVDVLRDQGFLTGFGIDVKDGSRWGDEDDPRIVGHEITAGNEEGGRRAMENLLQRDPSIDVVYTINEPAAAGAYEALKAFGREDDVLIVSVDGGCPGVRNVKEGVIGTTAQQYPLLMASLGIEAIKAWVDSGKRPEPAPGPGFFDTGAALITDKPIPGIESMDTKEGLDKCWG
ncbi:MAG: mannose-binding protein /fructose-binding protein /ribose-binding protein [Candidatus Kentron sp. G]|nr:MAG: mannose-binding protein /fructose-binding protein /ribose-binding protein [Candidatus Kentron sp. G]